LPTARRFLAQAEATFQRLARMPGIGTRYEPDEPLYAELRYFPVSRFRMYLVFYRPIPGGIEVLRVLHGARDIPGILAEDFGVEDTDDDAAEREAEPGE
jgi:toxin ParE1/3/4